MLGRCEDDPKVASSEQAMRRGEVQPPPTPRDADRRAPRPARRDQRLSRRTGAPPPASDQEPEASAIPPMDSNLPAPDTRLLLDRPGLFHVKHPGVHGPGTVGRFRADN